MTPRDDVSPGHGYGFVIGQILLFLIGSLLLAALGPRKGGRRGE